MTSLTASVTSLANSGWSADAAVGSAAFSVEHVTVAYPGHVALSDVNLRLSQGDRIALVGPSGAGKTTLLRLLNGSVRPSAGTVRCGDASFADLTGEQLRTARSAIGFVYQDLCLVPNVRVLTNVVAGRLGRLSAVESLRAMLFTPRDMLNEAYDLLCRVGVSEKIYQRTDRLSGGERQRVAIARALFQQPRALLADEPVSSVDPGRARDTIDLLTSVCGERQLTLCVSLHNLDLARDYFPRLVGLQHGRVVFDELTSQLDSARFESLYRLTHSRG